MMKIFMMVIFSLMMIYYNMMIGFYSNLCFIIVFMVFFYFSVSVGDYMCMLSVYFGGDSYSFFMMMLSLWIMGLMFLTLLFEEGGKIKLFMFVVMLLILLMFFSALNLMLLYFFFEVSLIPTFFIVLFWGSNWERLEAGVYLMLYMMFISFPFLIYIMKVFFYSGSLDMSVLSIYMFNSGGLDSELGGWEFLVVFGAFFIKLPIYLFHIWLPKAHVEAPVYGSMLLAAILLKLGGYGLLRMIMMFTYSCQIYKNMIMSISIVGALFVSILCLTQVDMKSLVAYSSVVHMNFMLCGMLVMSKFSVMGSYVVMISHGVCSSGLFFFVNVFYKRSFSRLVSLNKGLSSLMPSMGSWWFLLCVSNFSFPLSLNFLGEMMLIMMVLNWGGGFFTLFIGLICFFSGAYSLYLFSIIFHGEVYYEQVIDAGVLLEHLLGALHYFPLILLFLNLYMYIY